MLLEHNDYQFVVSNFNNNIIINFKIYSNLKTFKGTLPKKLNKFGFTKFKLDEILVEKINNNNGMFVEYNDLTHSVKLNFFDIIFPNGIFYQKNINIFLNEYIDFDENIDFENGDFKLIVKQQNDHIKLLNDKIILLEEKINKIILNY